jgi:FkbM family methyltransferase
VKLRNAIEFLGFRKQPIRYGYVVHDFSCDGKAMHFAKWQHPKEKRTEIECEHIDAYRRLLQAGDFCVDVGAHSGDSTLPMAIAVGTGGLVLAIEANPFVYHVLEKNIRLNRHVANIESIMAAALDSDKVMTFEYSDSGYCNGGRHEGISALRHGHAYKLQVHGIDIEKELRQHYADRLPRLRLVKVDTEGFDLYVVKAMRGILSEFRPIVKAEVFKKTSTEYRRQLLKYFEQLEYDVYRMDEEPVTRGPRLTQQNLSELKHYDVLCFPRQAADQGSSAAG